MIRRFLLVLFTIFLVEGLVWADPYLVCTPYAPAVVQPTYFELTFDGGTPVQSSPEVVVGGVRLHYNLASQSILCHNVVIKACNPSGCSESTAFKFLTINLQISTNENAICRYSTTNTTYELMVNTFSTTGGTTHTQKISLLTGGSYIYYTRCTDSIGNRNQSSTLISFNVIVGGAVDTGPGGAAITGGGGIIVLPN